MSTKKKAATSTKSAKAALTGTAVVPAQGVALALPGGFKAKRVLTLPTLVMKTAGEARALQFNSNLRVSSVPPKPGEAPATVADVVDMQTGEQFIFLVPAVVESSLIQGYGQPGEKPAREDIEGRTAQYEAAPIARLAFYIKNGGKAEGKRHVNFSIVEIEAPAVTVGPAD